MRNPIISATLVVFGFWWAIAFLWGIKEYGLLQDWMYLTVAIKAAILGLASFFTSAFVIWGKRWIDQGGLMETQTRGAQCSIGVLPGLTRWARNKKPVKVHEKRWPRTASWQKEAPKQYARAFQAILDTLGAQPRLPASPVAGGHGGETLLNHTLNVVETGLELLEGWTFDRRPNDPLAGSSVPADDRDVVVLILAGHDLGKLEAFRMEGTKVVEWKRSHDREGARILATMEEIWEIPEDDRKAMIAAVAHEHHPQDLPMHAGDRTRLLLEFLIDSDAEASRREEGKAHHRAENDELQSGVEVISPPQQNSFGEDEVIWMWFIDFLAKPGTINGKDKRFRVGFKGSDGRIVLNEVSIRRAMAEEFYKNPLMAENRKGDGRYTITENLMRILEERKVLLQTWNGQRFSHKNALFRVISRGKGGKVVGQWAAAIIVDLGENMPTSLRAMSPAPNPPEIVEAVFSQRAMKDVDDADQGGDGGKEEGNPAQIEDARHEEDSVTVTAAPHDSPALAFIEAESWDEPSASPRSSGAEEEGSGVRGQDEPSAPPAQRVTDMDAREVRGQDEHLDHAPHALHVSLDNAAQESDLAPDTQVALAEDESEIRSFGYGGQALDAVNLAKRGKGGRPCAEKTDRAKEFHAVLTSSSVASDKKNKEITDKERAAQHESGDFTGTSGRKTSPSLHCKRCGSLAKAILKGMEKQRMNIEQKQESDGSLSLSSSEVVKLSALGGLRVVNLDDFLTFMGDNPRVLGGLTFIRNEKGRVERVIIHLGDSANQE